VRLASEFLGSGADVPVEPPEFSPCPGVVIEPSTRCEFSHHRQRRPGGHYALSLGAAIFFIHVLRSTALAVRRIPRRLVDWLDPVILCPGRTAAPGCEGRVSPVFRIPTLVYPPSDLEKLEDEARTYGQCSPDFFLWLILNLGPTFTTLPLGP